MLKLDTDILLLLLGEVDVISGYELPLLRAMAKIHTSG